MVAYNYVFIGLLLVAAVVFAMLPVLGMTLIGPRKRSRSKGDGYECGILPTGDGWVRFRIQYYIYAMMFVVFDVETVFLFPWAAAYGRLGPFALVEMAVFLAILAAGLAYAWAKGVLRWA